MILYELKEGFILLNRDEATSICRQKGMGDRKIQEVMSKLKGGGDVSLECLEDLLLEFPQPKTDQSSETNSCTSTDVFIDDSAISTASETTKSATNSEGSIMNAAGMTNNVSRGTNFLELANTVSTYTPLDCIKSHRNSSPICVIVLVVCLFCPILCNIILCRVYFTYVS